MPQPSLVQIVQDYYAFRGLTQPNAGQAFLFLTSEVGELADAFVHDQAAWVRNNPDRERDVGIRGWRHPDDAHRLCRHPER